MSFSSIAWVYDASDQDGLSPIVIERCRQMDGSTLYAVRQVGACMDRCGEWIHEPRPSSRDDAFLQQFRFGSWDAAAAAITRHCGPKGRFT